MTDENQPLPVLHRILIARHKDLSARLEAATEPAVARALLGELQELIHRLNLTQNLLLVEATSGLSRALDKVAAADRTLGKELDAAAGAAAVIRKMSLFFTYVDKVIDLAKAVAAV